jgi:hypothetical protein
MALTTATSFWSRPPNRELHPISLERGSVSITFQTNIPKTNSQNHWVIAVRRRKTE